ncbi:hypothetical protein ABTD62_21765, partial [Acinetobacter baumannii]
MNPTFFVIWTTLTIALWSFLGWRVRQYSREADEAPMSIEQGANYIWRGTIRAAMFTVWFALTVGSTI